MKNLKLISVAIALSTLLTGCTSNTQPDVPLTESTNQTPETISLKVWGGSPDQDILLQMIESFKKEHEGEAEFNITLEVSDEGDCKDMILADINNAPDVFAFADDQLLELSASGILEPLSSSDTIKNDNLEGSVEAASIDGELYAYPLTADNGYFMFYNKKYFKEEDLNSLDTMLEIASQQNKKITYDLDNSWYLYSFFANTGLTLELLDDELTNYCDWNSTTQPIKGVDVGNALLDLSRHPGFLIGTDQALNDGAKDGTVIAGVSGVWNASILHELWGDDLSATKLPTYQCAGQDIQMGSYAGYKLLGTNAYSPNKEWANKLAVWLSSPENQLLRFQIRGVGPSNAEIAMNPEVQDSPQIKALLMQSEYASFQRVGPKYWGAADDFGEKIAKGELSYQDMQDALDEMVKVIQMDVTE